jgi:hypothetical protein
VRLSRHEWEVRVCGRAEAVGLIEQYHYSRSAANTATYRHGLYRKSEGVLAHPLGAAIWIPPTKGAAIATTTDGEDWRGVLALSRLVIAPEVPPNGASFLMGRSMQMIDRSRWPVLVTYADTRMGHTGAIYRATNWTEIGPVPAGDVWIGANGEQRGRKRGPRTLTRDEMAAAGFTKAPAAPKIKFVHRLAVAS